MKPYYEARGIVLYHMDCREFLAQQGDGSYDAVITDPPYGVGVAYEGGKASDDKIPPFEVLTECLRVSSGSVLWFGSGSRVCQDVAAMLLAPDRLLVWYKPHAAPVAKDRIFYHWDAIHCWRLPKQHDGPATDVVVCSTTGKKDLWNHPGTKPIRLMCLLIGFCPPGGTILDPFAGSGTTLVAALLRGYKAVGVEIVESYCEIAANRLQLEASRMLYTPNSTSMTRQELDG